MLIISHRISHLITHACVHVQFQQLLILAANSTSVLDHPFDSEDLTLALKLTSAVDQSKLFKAMPENLKTIGTKEKVSYNNHGSGMTPKRFESIQKLVDFYNVLSTNEDKKGTSFISTIEAKKYPIYGVQWHPEKIQLFVSKHISSISNSFASCPF